MIINQLSVILDSYKTYGHDFVSTPGFQKYFEDTLAQGNAVELLFSLAYEAKDFGESIEEDGNTSTIANMFNKTQEHITDNLGTYNDTKIRMFFLAKSIFAKYFVFATKKEYLTFYTTYKDKGYSTDKLLLIFDRSIRGLYESFQNLTYVLNGYQSYLYGGEDSPWRFDFDSTIMYGTIMKELNESYVLLEALGDEDSYPNIDTSYVYVDQLHNSDFFSTAARQLYEWCVKNAKQ